MIRVPFSDRVKMPAVGLAKAPEAVLTAHFGRMARGRMLASAAEIGCLGDDGLGGAEIGLDGNEPSTHGDNG